MKIVNFTKKIEPKSKNRCNEKQYMHNENFVCIYVVKCIKYIYRIKKLFNYHKTKYYYIFLCEILLSSLLGMLSTNK